ncbi:RIP metalloprotease RseP [Aquicoccus porphyridii]|uniref:Zinc metalloprotease n=1 Tax=Aquicoccus porphyridii TaxID=1852029 RepID=A0A5A9ZUI6_9RHOB|nr:RIP metalloprotease RseP [Aquicoccus porphyridii]KAA0921038.1 RIP metalloprotease RseP [Aquicoccus porphyridii]RAI56426.1 RIP metalloprotease RseP [Rhodobacteraceae bacterium AsT-22]
MDISLIPQFGGFVMTVIAFVVALSVIVAVHEYGHYIVGRWSGIKAEVFSLGFGPVLWSRHDRHGTKWQIAALPFGGYVKFLGDSNAASAKDEEAAYALSEEELRHSMHGAPLWARTVTVAAGPIFNFILSILVFAGVILWQGQVAEPLTVGSFRALPGEVQELREGDEVIAIGGVRVPAFEDREAFRSFGDAVPVEPVLDYDVRRDAREMRVGGPYPYPPLVTQLSPQSAAYDIGLQVGDVITAVDGTPIFAFEQLRERVEGGNGKPLLLSVWRDGAALEFTLVPRRVDEPQAEGGFKTSWRIGIAGGLFFEPATEMTGVGSALWGGVVQTERIVQGSISGLWHMITGAISSCNMSGPIGIAQVSGAMASQGAVSFIWFIAVLSTAVGLLNLFPIPVLDGGHLVFYGYEAVAGRPPSDGALRILMTVGLTLILSLMVFALSNDLFCP